MFKLYVKNLTLVENTECNIGFSIYGLYYNGLSDKDNNHVIWAASQNLIWVIYDKYPCKVK